MMKIGPLYMTECDFVEAIFGCKFDGMINDGRNSCVVNICRALILSVATV